MNYEVLDKAYLSYISRFSGSATDLKRSIQVQAPKTYKWETGNGSYA